jgi:hypothetical protein
MQWSLMVYYVVCFALLFDVCSSPSSIIHHHPSAKWRCITSRALIVSVDPHGTCERKFQKWDTDAVGPLELSEMSRKMRFIRRRTLHTRCPLPVAVLCPCPVVLSWFPLMIDVRCPQVFVPVRRYKKKQDTFIILLFAASSKDIDNYKQSWQLSRRDTDRRKSTRKRRRFTLFGCS